MTADPMTNGHAPAPERPQPSPQAALNAVRTRNQVLRQTLEAREDELDWVNSMFMTQSDQMQAMTAENSQLKAQLAEQSSPTLNTGTPGDGTLSPETPEA